METLTMYFNDLYESLKFELGSECHQLVQGRSIISESYKEVNISGSLIQETVFEDVIFDSCNFFGTNFENCIFINCLFINCTFQFSHLEDCNFESSSVENCKWILTKLTNTDLSGTEENNNYSYLTEKTKSHKIIDLNIILDFCA